MIPITNMLYFNSDIDVRLCLKNGSSTLQQAWALINQTTVPTPEQRHSLIMTEQDVLNPPFRPGSYRIAIKRNPIERFVSTITMMSLNTWTDRYINSSWNKNLKALIDINDVSKTIEHFKNNKIKDQHFMSQTHYMGKSSDYDKVYYLHELPHLLKWLEKKTKTHQNISNLWINKTEKSLNVTKLEQLEILNLYNMDCVNGWC